MKTIIIDKQDSTNEYLKREYDNLKDLSIVSTNNQECLEVSILLKSFNKKEDLHKLTQVVTCSVAGFLQQNNIPAKIKWPSDIYVNDKKIGEVIIETIIKDKLEAVIIGIKVHVNTTSEYISMYQVTNKKYNINTVLTGIKTYFSIYYNLYKQNKYQDILDYANDIAYLKDKWVEYQDYGLVCFKELHDNGMVTMIDKNKQSYQILASEIE